MWTGSTDPGPHYLGSGKTLNSKLAMRRDLGLMLAAARTYGVPLVVGTAGGAGGRPHLEATADIIRDLAREQGQSFRLALIDAEQDPATLKAAQADGRMSRLTGGPAPSEAALESSERVVAMMGPEPFAAALDGGRTLSWRDGPATRLLGRRLPCGGACHQHLLGIPERCLNAVPPRDPERPRLFACDRGPRRRGAGACRTRAALHPLFRREPQPA